MKKCRFGIMGAGRIAGKFADTFRWGLVQEAELLAVASTNRERAQAFAVEHNVPKPYSYEALLADPEIDAVYIATTNNAHYQQCLDVIAAGKAVLCEKPLVLTSREAEDLIRAAQEKGVFLMEAMWTRFTPAVQQAKKWLDDNRIGALRSISASFCNFFKPGPSSDRVFLPELGGGAMFDIGVYPFMMAQYFAGDRKLEKVNPVSVLAETGVDISTFLHLIYDDGLVAEVKCSMAFDTRCEALICGERGYIRIAPPMSSGRVAQLFTNSPPPLAAQSDPIPTELFVHETPSGFEFEIDHVARCIREGKTESEIMTFHDTLECARVYDIVTAAMKKQ